MRPGFSLCAPTIAKPPGIARGEGRNWRKSPLHKWPLGPSQRRGARRSGRKPAARCLDSGLAPARQRTILVSELGSRRTEVHLRTLAHFREEAFMTAPVFRSIVHPTDFSKASIPAFAHALRIAVGAKSRLHLLNVARREARENELAPFPRVRKTLIKWGIPEADAPATKCPEFEDLRSWLQRLRGHDPCQLPRPSQSSRHTDNRHG